LLPSGRILTVDYMYTVCTMIPTLYGIHTFSQVFSRRVELAITRGFVEDRSTRTMHVY